MSRRPRPAGLIRIPAPLPVAAVLACGALAGCSGAHPPAVFPCARTGPITGLVISRIIAQPQNHRTFTFPATITVAGAKQAKPVVRFMCQLPKAPAGTTHCPPDLGIRYRLVFSAGHRKLTPVTADITGCMQVHGMSPVRSTIRSPGFWTVLAIEAHIPPVNAEDTLRGR